MAFLKALSDDSARYERAPFDHPELCVPVGHEGDESGGLKRGDVATSAAERWRRWRRLSRAEPGEQEPKHLARRPTQDVPLILLTDRQFENLRHLDTEILRQIRPRHEPAAGHA